MNSCLFIALIISLFYATANLDSEDTRKGLYSPSFMENIVIKLGDDTKFCENDYFPVKNITNKNNTGSTNFTFSDQDFTCKKFENNTKNHEFTIRSYTTDYAVRGGIIRFCGKARSLVYITAKDHNGQVIPQDEWDKDDDIDTGCRTVRIRGFYDLIISLQETKKEPVLV